MSCSRILYSLYIRRSFGNKIARQLIPLICHVENSYKTVTSNVANRNVKLIKYLMIDCNHGYFEK